MSKWAGGFMEQRLIVRADAYDRLGQTGNAAPAANSATEQGTGSREFPASACSRERLAAHFLSAAMLACAALAVPRPAQAITNPPPECEPPSRVTAITSPTAGSNFHPAPRNITI